jgi:uncharacterized protein (UPF0548 family)
MLSGGQVTLRLMTRDLNYESVGATRPIEQTWADESSGFLRYERRVLIGYGSGRWETVADEVLDWGVKTRSGFTVRSVTGDNPRAQDGEDYLLTARIGPFTLHEPVRVVAVVEQSDRSGFAYGTLEGHPVSGEEAFIVHRTPDGAIWLTLRSLTRPAHGRWRHAFPAILVAQRWYRWRYRRAFLMR